MVGMGLDVLCWQESCVLGDLVCRKVDDSCRLKERRDVWLVCCQFQNEIESGCALNLLDGLQFLLRSSSIVISLLIKKQNFKKINN